MAGKYRTQLYLNEAQYLFLKESAAKYRTSLAGVVRALIDREIGDAGLVDEHDPLFHLAAMAVETGREDGAENHDRYLYQSRLLSRSGTPAGRGESERS